MSEVTGLEIAKEIAFEMNSHDMSVGIFPTNQIDQVVVEETINCLEDGIETVSFTPEKALVRISEEYFVIEQEDIMGGTEKLDFRWIARPALEADLGQSN
jgi:hypothetical protein